MKKLPKFYIDILEVKSDERVAGIVEALSETDEKKEMVGDLIERIVHINNVHIWGFLLSSIQMGEDE